jgi:hypothetical protein
MGEHGGTGEHRGVYFVYKRFNSEGLKSLIESLYFLTAHLTKMSL